MLDFDYNIRFNVGDKVRVNQVAYDRYLFDEAQHPKHHVWEVLETEVRDGTNKQSLKLMGFAQPWIYAYYFELAGGAGFKLDESGT